MDDAEEIEFLRAELGYMVECAIAVVETYRTYDSLLWRERTELDRQERIVQQGLRSLVFVSYTAEEARRRSQHRVASAIDKVSPLEVLALAGPDRARPA